MLTDQKLSFTVDEAVTATGLNRSRIYQAIASGALATFKVGRQRLFTRRALESFIANLERESAKRGAA